MVEDVGLEPLFHIPNVACYHYTTPSIYGISYWDSNPYLAVLETAVLPIKLRILVGIEGLEPPTRCLRDTYYTNLVIFPFGDNGQIRTDEYEGCSFGPYRLAKIPYNIYVFSLYKLTKDIDKVTNNYPYWYSTY